MVFYVETVTAISLGELDVLAALVPTLTVVDVGLHALGVEACLFGHIADVEFDSACRLASDTKVVPVTVPPRITITPNKTVKLIGLDPYHRIQITTLKLRIKPIVCIPLRHPPPQRRTPHHLNRILQHLHIQPILLPRLPAIVVLLVDLHAVAISRARVDESVVAIRPDVTQQPVHVEVAVGEGDGHEGEFRAPAE